MLNNYLRIAGNSTRLGMSIRHRFTDLVQEGWLLVNIRGCLRYPPGAARRASHKLLHQPLKQLTVETKLLMHKRPFLECRLAVLIGRLLVLIEQTNGNPVSPFE